MNGALSCLSYSWDLEKQRGGGGGCFKVIIWGVNANHKGAGNFGAEMVFSTM